MQQENIRSKGCVKKLIKCIKASKVQEQLFLIYLFLSISALLPKLLLYSIKHMMDILYKLS